VKTIAQQIQRQRAAVIVRLQALDPTRLAWSLTDSFRDLLAAFDWLRDRGRAA
jgi:hypothetical protein